MVVSAISGLLAATLAGCSALGLGTSGPTPGTTSSPPPSGDSWLVVQEGKVVPSTTPAGARRSVTPDATLSMGPTGSACPDDWSGGSIMIPVTVTAGRGSLTVSWPRQRRSNYHIAAVPQKLVGGVQPAPVWRPVVADTSGCTITTTISGLRSGQAYIVWLDAPNPGFERDGTRHPYSGRSGVVYPL
jgi:hypothetical protein